MIRGDYMFKSFIIGLILGIVYFGGLYYTSKKFYTFKNPSLLILLSFFIRNILLLSVFYYLVMIDYKNLLICTLAVISVKHFIILKVKVI